MTRPDATARGPLTGAAVPAAVHRHTDATPCPACGVPALPSRALAALTGR